MFRVSFFGFQKKGRSQGYRFRRRASTAHLAITSPHIAPAAFTRS